MAVQQGPTLEIGEIGVRPNRVVGFRRNSLGGSQLDLQGRRHTLGDLGLHREHVIKVAIVDVGPQVSLRTDVDQLQRDPEPIAGLPHASLEDRAYPQFGADLGHGFAAGLVPDPPTCVR